MGVGIAEVERMGAFHAGTLSALEAVEEVIVYAAGANRGAPFFSEAGDVDHDAAMLTMDETKPIHARRSLRRRTKED